MKYTLKRRTSKPFLHIKNNFTSNVNNEFEILTGYIKEELLGKSIAEISNILRIDSKNLLENTESEHICYIFTKKCEPREVTITCKRNHPENEQVFFIKEKVNSRIEERLSYAMSILLDNEIGVAIYSIPDLIFLKANLKFFENVHNKNEDYIGKSLKEIIPGFKESRFEKIILNIIKTGDKYEAKEVKYNCSKKCVAYWDSSYVPIYANDEVKYLVHTVIDVTEKVVLRKIIEEQKQELDAIIENMSDELIIFNSSGNYTKINKAARANPIIDFKNIKNVKEIQSHAKLYDMHGNLILPDMMPFTRVIKGEKIKNFRIVKNDNKGILYKELNGTPIYDCEGNFIAGVIVLRDITERLKYEETFYIKAQYESLSRIIENIDLGFARYTYPEFNFIDINTKGYNQLKQFFPSISSQSEIKSQNLFDIFDGKVYIIDDMVQESLKINKKSCFKVCKYNIADEKVFFKWIYQPLFDLNNEIIEIIIIGIDITEEIKEKEKMEKVLKIQDEVYANVSHELKTPLNVIFSANQMMEMYLKNDRIEYKKEKFYPYNNIIKQNCYRLIKLINNVLDMSKINSGLLKLNQINENIVGIVENIVQSVSEYVKSRELSIIFDTEVEEKIIACDPDKIERVILNLISNAIKFSNPNGVIYVNVIEKRDIVEISVKDTGKGIEKKHLDLIFQRFYQADKSLSRNAEGTGIGLSLIKSFVELHGGKVSVESEVDKGSTFKVELPARIIEIQNEREQTHYMNDKVEILNIEFSDIYSKF